MKAKADSDHLSSVVCLTKEQIEQLGTCYLGMREGLKKQVRDYIQAGVSRDQAIFNVIFEPRLELYYNQGVDELNGVVRPKRRN